MFTKQIPYNCSRPAAVKDYGIGTLHYNWPMSAHVL